MLRPLRLLIQRRLRKLPRIMPHRHRSPSRFNRRQLLANTTASIATIATGTMLTSIASGQSRRQRTSRRDATDDDDQQARPKHLTFESPQIQHWRIGLVLETPVTCGNVFASFAIPRDWPEQKVTVIGQTIDPLVSGWETRDLFGGARQVALHMSRVPAGSTVECTFQFQIERSRILLDGPTDDLVIPSRSRRELRAYLGNSPFIDASNARIKAVARELAAQPTDNAWQTVEQIYDYVRDNVEYVEGSIKNASQALKDGQGDCEEMTSLFVALCRNAKIPARMVWIPDHCYPEFYLEDSQGNGTWFPCQAAGTRQFGRMDEYRPVLQKGDRFKIPEKKTPVRYVSEYFRCDKRGKGDPNPKFIREQIDVVAADAPSP